MADNRELEYATATGNDYPAHEQTYRSFVTLVKVVIAVVAIIVGSLMAYFADVAKYVDQAPRWRARVQLCRRARLCRLGPLRQGSDRSNNGHVADIVGESVEGDP